MNKNAIFHALSFRERVSWPGSPSFKEAPAELLEWWIEQNFDNRPDLYVGYLKILGLPTYELPEPADLQNHPEILRIKRAHHRNTASKATWTPEGGAFGHEWLCAALISQALAAVSEALDSVHGFVPDKKKILGDFYGLLNHRLYDLMMPALVLEANAARLHDADADKSPEDRYRAFAHGLGDPVKGEEFWAKYPVLWRRAALIALNCRDAGVETIRRIDEDVKEIRGFFGVGEDEALTSIVWGAGDTHRGGRTVAHLLFTRTRLVYKPKSLKVDIAFGEFLEWFSTRNSGLDFKSCKVLDRGTYGYSEFVQYQKCETPEELAAYYARLGALTAIFWLLGGTDLHHENLIACGPYPVSVDLETLFERPVQREQDYQSLFFDAFEGLLLKTCILPFRERGLEGIKDISAMRTPGAQSSDMETRHVENMARDDMRVVAKPGVIPKSDNIPTEEPSYRLVDHLPAFVAGYELAFDALVKSKDRLLAPRGVLAAFKGVPVRWIGRRTQTYGTLLENLAHPSVLGDGLESDMLMGRLWHLPQHDNGVNQLVPSEARDLWAGDIPYFWTLPDSKDLHDAEGNATKGFFAEDGFAALRRRLDGMPSCKAAQLESIRNAIFSSAPIIKDPPAAVAIEEAQSLVVSDDLLSAANLIGQELAEKAQFSDSVPFWTGLSQLDDTNFTANILPATLYEGAPGIGIFFAYLNKFCPNPVYRKIAEGTHRQVEFILRHPGQYGKCGAFSGTAGVIYADLVLALALNRPLATTDKTFEDFIATIEQDTFLDVVGGAAGALIVSLRFYERTKNPVAFRAARAAAEKLIATQVAMGDAVAWPIQHEGATVHLGGLAHGASGMAWAFAEFFRLSKLGTWKALARRAFAYEESLFDATTGAWRDLRNKDEFGCAWCHGAAGIGLCATRLGGSVDGRKINTAIAAAKAFTLKSGFSNHSLCHGALGNAELFLATNDPRAKVLASQVVRSGSLICGLPGNTDAPGLLCGKAGIGYGLLRNAYPGVVPSVLLLETA